MEKSLRLKSDGFEPFRLAAGTAAKGHEDAFPRPRLSVRCLFSQRALVGTWGNGQDAPIADLPGPT